MFASIHRTYDLLNHVLSANRDRAWRRRLREALAPAPSDLALDVCTGTADQALELAGWVRRVVACDFVLPMVARGQRKAARRGAPVVLLAADALALPFADAVFDLVTVSFGIRNVVDLDRCLREMARVAAPGGRLGILEFSLPRGRWLRRAYLSYFQRVLPRVGRMVSRHSGAYTYLPDTVVAFPEPEEIARRLEAAGWQDVAFSPLSGGIVTLYRAVRGKDR